MKFSPERLTQARKLQGITQKHLAERLGVIYQMVQKWEYGRSAPSGENLKGLALALGKPTEYFFEDEDDEAPHEEPRDYHRPPGIWHANSETADFEWDREYIRAMEPAIREAYRRGSLARNLKMFRLAFKFSEEACARSTGEKLEAYQKWERGEGSPDPQSLWNLSRHYGVWESDLLAML